MTEAETNANEYPCIYFELNTQCETYVKGLGIPYSTLSALRVILEHDGDYIQRTICEYTFLPKQAVSAIVTALLRHGAIRMVESNSDRGHKMIHPTDEGQTFAPEAIQKMKNVESEAIESLDENQKEMMLVVAKLHATRFRDYLLG